MKSFTRLLLTAVFAMTASCAAFASFDGRTGTISDERWNAGIPLGGIGCGKVELMTDGHIGRATINHNWDRATGDLKGAFFAVSVRGDGESAARILRLKDAVEYSNVKNIASTEYTGKMPFARVKFPDSGLPADVSLEAFSSLIPYNSADSAIPAGHFVFTVTNTSRDRQDVSLLFSWPNILGFGGKHFVNWESTVGNSQSYKPLKNADALVFGTRQLYDDSRMNTVGSYLIGAERSKGARFSYVLDWDASGDEVPFWNSFEKEGALDPGRGGVNTDAKRQPASAAAVSVSLAPGETRRVAFILAWYMPHHVTIRTKVTNTGKSGRSGKDVENMLDGNPTTKWTTGRAMMDGDALVADFGEVRKLRKVILDMSADRWVLARSLRFETSDDGMTWNKAAEYDKQQLPRFEQLGILTLPFDNLETRYLRIVETAAEKQHQWGVGELKFYAVVAGEDGAKTVRIKPVEVHAELMIAHTDVTKEDAGHFYMNRFKNVEQVAEYAVKNRDRLRTGSVLLERVVERSNMPFWLKLKIINTQYVLFTNGIYTKDGRFTVLESPSDMTGALGTMDQRMASHAYYTMFFPGLDKTELRQFAKCQRPDGRITHFDGNVHEIVGDPDVEYGITDWPDLSSSWTMQVLKEYRWTGDKRFLAEMWPHVKRVMAWLEARDSDGDFIPEGGSTYDYEAPSPGSFSYTASAYLGALESAAEAARVMRDTKMLRHYEGRLAAARESVMNNLWTGSNFNKWFDPATGNKNENSFIASLAGDWLARLSGLPRTLEPDVIHKAAANMLMIHAKPFHPVPPMEVKPDGTPATKRCYVMQHEPYLGMESMYEGFTDDGLDVIERVYYITWVLNKDPWQQHLSVFAPEGKAEGLVDYMTAPATWHVFNALSGVTVDVNAGTLFVSPRPSTSMPELHVPVFLSRAWLWLDYVPGRVFRLRVINQAGAKPVVIRKLRMDGDAPEIKLRKAFTMKTGAELDLIGYEKQLAPFDKSLNAK